MTNTINLDVQERLDANKADNKRLRRDGYLLGNISRKGNNSVAVAMKKEDFKKLLKQAGRNSVFTLKSDQNNFNVMVKGIQTSLKDYDYTHIDFQLVSLDEEVKTEAPITYSGTEFLESQKAVLHRHTELLTVNGLPQDIPEVINIDLSNFKAGDNIYIKDITLPKGITTEIDPEQLVATIAFPKLKETATEEEVTEE